MIREAEEKVEVPKAEAVFGFGTKNIVSHLRVQCCSTSWRVV